MLNGGTISIRKFAKQNITLDIMARQGNLSAGMARFLQFAAHMRASILVSGGTGSGKTTLLNAISRYIDPGERIITIEDAVELRLQQPHVVQMETRSPNIEGVGEIPQRELAPELTAHASGPHHRWRSAGFRSLRHAAGHEYRA